MEAHRKIMSVRPLSWGGRAPPDASHVVLCATPSSFVWFSQLEIMATTLSPPIHISRLRYWSEPSLAEGNTTKTEKLHKMMNKKTLGLMFGIPRLFVKCHFALFCSCHSENSSATDMSMTSSLELNQVHCQSHKECLLDILLQMLQ